VAPTFAGRVHVKWDAAATVTPFGQLLSQAGRTVRRLGGGLSIARHKPESDEARSFGLLSAGHRRYA
jgi:hypothetical protein